MSKILFVCSLGMLLCCGGCRAVAALSTPTQWEVKEPAEYKLADNKPAKMLVLVEQPAWASSEANMRLYLAHALEGRLADKVGTKAEIFVPYQKVADLRGNRDDFAMLSPAEVGKALEAQMVLYIVIDNFGLYGLSDAGYYRGQLDTRSCLYDVETGRKLWPESDELSKASVGFEMQKGHEESAKRLSIATAKCVVRHLYDCPKKEYRVSDEIKKGDIESW